MNDAKICQLRRVATRIRKNVIESVYAAGSGHPGGSLSIADLLAVLYFKEMNVDPDNPQWNGRDRLVLSKGHAAPALYSVLAERGFFPREEMKRLRQADSILQGHPDMRKVPGVDMSTGSLGQGISAAVGMALSGKAHKKDYRVYVILGDGELEEGQVWEAAMCAAHYRLDNLTAFIDFNGLQIDGDINEIMSPCPVKEKFEAFGWHVISVDGHDYNEISGAINISKTINKKPTIIILQTVKGKGVSFMERRVEWHGTAPNKEQYELAISELEAVLDSLEVE